MALIDATLIELARLVQQDGLVLVECWTPSCASCRAFHPVFEHAAARHPAHTFARIDIKAGDDWSEALGVEYTPELMVYRDGFLLFKQAGNYSEDQLEDIVRQAAAVDVDLVRAHAAATQEEEGASAAG